MHYHCLPSSPHGVLVQGQAVLFPMQLPDDVPGEGSKWWMTYLAPWEICGIKGWCSQLLSSSCSSPIIHSLLKSESTDEKVLPLSLTCSLSTSLLPSSSIPLPPSLWYCVFQINFHLKYTKWHIKKAWWQFIMAYSVIKMRGILSCVATCKTRQHHVKPQRQTQRDE